MDQIEVAPYIFFQGNCREAMEFYKNVFGGELNLMAYEDIPNSPMPAEEAASMKGLLMNASLTGGIMVIRGSDTKNASAAAKKVTLCLTSSDEATLTKVFEGLSNGADVFHPLKKEFWGDTFGQLTDKFGVDWMIDITPKK